MAVDGSPDNTFNGGSNIIISRAYPGYSVKYYAPGGEILISGNYFGTEIWKFKDLCACAQSTATITMSSTNTPVTPTVTPTITQTVSPTTSSTPTNISTPCTNFILAWGTLGTGQGQFNQPFGTAINSSGNVYVVDHVNSRVQEFDSNGAYITQWGSYGNGNGQFESLEGGIAIDGYGNVFVADSGNNRIQEFTSAGIYINQYGNGLLNFPQGIAIDGIGNMYICDTWNNRVVALDSSGNQIHSWGGYGISFNGLQGIALDAAGNVYVTDTQNNRIQEFSPIGTFIRQWGIQGNGNGQFQLPGYIAVDNYGVVYVTDEGGNRIQEFSPLGDYIGQWGNAGSGNGQFSTPVCIAVDNKGYIYVDDMQNNRIEKFGCPAATPTATPTNTPGLCLHLDSSFNTLGSTPGIVTYQGAAGVIGDYGYGLVKDNLGNVIVAGMGVNTKYNYDAVLWNFSNTGILNSLFNPSGTTPGIAVFDNLATGAGDDAAYKVTYDNAGRIIVVGHSHNANWHYNLAVWRYLSNGTLDAGFNSPYGFVTHDNAAGGSGDDNGRDVVIGPNNTIFVVGGSTTSNGTTDMAIWSYDNTGSLNLGFNGTGILTNNSAAGGNSADVGNGIAIDSSLNTIYATGSSVNVNGQIDMVIWRYSVNGTGGPFVLYNNGSQNGFDVGYDVKMDNNNKIVVVGYDYTANGYNMVIWRYNQSGTLDATFNGSGIAMDGSNISFGYALAIDQCNRIYVTGTRNDLVAVWRYTQNGNLDLTFDGGTGTPGYITSNLGFAAVGYDITIGNSGELYVAGSGRGSNNYSDMFLLKYLNFCDTGCSSY
jgi:uncharacterized delta-60 repeat protein